MTCIICGKDCGLFAQRHHKFSQTVVNLKLYGKKRINDKRNIQYPVCGRCNISHAAQGKGLEIWREEKFCEVMGIEPRSKNSKLRSLREAKA